MWLNSRKSNGMFGEYHNQLCGILNVTYTNILGMDMNWVLSNHLRCINNYKYIYIDIHTVFHNYIYIYTYNLYVTGIYHEIISKLW